MGLAAQPPNVPVVPPSERVAAKPAIREYDPHVGYPPSTKQWYTLVRLDEYGPGASDAELRELEERILSEPDDTSDDDALGSGIDAAKSIAEAQNSGRECVESLGCKRSHPVMGHRRR